MPQEQSYARHTKWDPGFHFFLAPIALINLIVNIVGLVRNPTAGTAWSVVIAVAALIAVVKMRLYSLKVQDRVIRLEERLRLAQCLPDPLRSRIGELSRYQLVALRFASDAELPGLVENVLSGKTPDAPTIKKSIQMWRADFFRV